MSASFSSTYAQFIAELKLTFPEYVDALTAAESHPPARFSELWAPYTADVAARNQSIFTEAGIPLVHGVPMTARLWSELSSKTQSAIWNYISSLLLLLASTESEPLWDLSGFRANLETLMKGLSEAPAEGAPSLPEGFASLFEKMAAFRDSTKNETSGTADGGTSSSGGGGSSSSSSSPGGIPGIPGFKIPERLFKGHIAKIAEELVRDFKPEEFGIDPSVLESKDPAHVFAYLQEIFTRKPEMIMGAAQKIGKRLQAKFARGELNRDEIIREAEELMKEFSENTAFSSLFGSLGELFKSGERESGNEGSLRRREVQERLRKKQAAKANAMPTTNVVTMGSATAAAATAATATAAAAALLAEEEAEKAAAAAAAAKGKRSSKK